MATKRKRKVPDPYIRLVRVYLGNYMHAFRTEHPVQDEREPTFDGDALTKFREVEPFLADGAVVEFGNQAVGFSPVSEAERDRLRNGSPIWRDVDAGSVVVG